MKSIRITLPNKGNIKIIPFADVHIGSTKCDLQLLKQQVEKVKNDPDAFAVILGDLINNSTKTSVGDVFSQPLSPMEQMKVAMEVFEPIKDKILAITTGNHERRSYKNDGTDLGWFFANSLGIGHRYDYCAPLLFLSFGKIGGNVKGLGTNHVNRNVTYTIYMTHGDGCGGRLVGGKANGLERRGQIINADLIIVGHTHQPLTFKQSCFEINYHSKIVEEKETTFVNCASMLDYEEYAELYGLRPSSKSQPEIILSGNKKEIKVVV